MNRKKKKLVDFFYKTVFINGDEKKIPYEWKPGEKELYIKTCEAVKEWGGIPLDVPWASTTGSYLRALKSPL